MRYESGTCQHCPAQTKHIPGGYVHADTGQVRAGKGYREHAAAPSFDNRPGALPLTYPAAQQALTIYGRSYAEYIQTNTAEHVAKGHYSEEHAHAASLGSLLAGNDGA